MIRVKQHFLLCFWLFEKAAETQKSSHSALPSELFQSRAGKIITLIFKLDLEKGLEGFYQCF